MKKIHDAILAAWYSPKVSIGLGLLWPFAILYRIIIALRKKNAHSAFKSQYPIVVVGNITIGGNGKTPAIITLVELLKKQGFNPGVISRGYPINPQEPILVSQNSQAHDVGDETLLIYLKTKVPVAVCKDRVKAIQYLESHHLCDVILSDDGLQNTSFQHDIDIVMVDSMRGFGNKCLLPMGPLREPISRLSEVDFVITKQVAEAKNISEGYVLNLLSNPLQPLISNADNIKTFTQPAYAITAIANPESFFKSLTSLGVEFKACTYPDHYAFTPEDFINKQGSIIMTEKDAVKCRTFADARFWCLPLDGRFNTAFEQKFIAKLKAISTR